jgi:NAD(P)-dependent dehydrogenase (short-subunit alcohol dehydrogenase family)
MGVMSARKRAVAFFAWEDAGYITGQMLYVDGGHTLV